MSFSPIPKLVVPDIFAVTPDLLRRKGITFLCLDLDNTLSPYSEDMPPKRVLDWMAELKAAGIDLYMISNSAKSRRADDYAKACGIPFVKCAGKPRPKALRDAMQQMDKTPAETALMGDQIFTDGLCANRAGALSIVVKPIEMKNIFFRIRYGVEQLFRVLSKERIK
ncbi:MAG: YqeG family HAD IIIA-type phosphatase [Oscillospiraceae bacterium]|nr:YqeG family HAD IIIA-type phosphatase [Oscillospiraceae bacterium]